MQKKYGIGIAAVAVGVILIISITLGVTLTNSSSNGLTDGQVGVTVVDETPDSRTEARTSASPASTSDHTTPANWITNASTSTSLLNRTSYPLIDGQVFGKYFIM